MRDRTNKQTEDESRFIGLQVSFFFSFVVLFSGIFFSETADWQPGENVLRATVKLLWIDVGFRKEKHLHFIFAHVCRFFFSSLSLRFLDECISCLFLLMMMMIGVPEGRERSSVADMRSALSEIPPKKHCNRSLIQQQILVVYFLNFGRLTPIVDHRRDQINREQLRS